LAEVTAPGELTGEEAAAYVEEVITAAGFKESRKGKGVFYIEELLSNLVGICGLPVRVEYYKSPPNGPLYAGLPPRKVIEFCWLWPTGSRPAEMSDRWLLSVGVRTWGGKFCVDSVDDHKPWPETHTITEDYNHIYAGEDDYTPGPPPDYFDEWIKDQKEDPRWELYHKLMAEIQQLKHY
jgi:hypothetical protein